MPLTKLNKGKMKDVFNPITNPGGGMPSYGKSSLAALLTSGDKAPVDRSKLTVGPNSKISDMFGGGQQIGEGWRGSMSNMQINPQSGLIGRKPGEAGRPVSAQAPVAPAPSSYSAPVGGGALVPPVVPGAPAPGVVDPMAPAPEATAGETPQQWMNPDGTMKTPEQVAQEISSSLQAAQGQGDVGRFAGAEFSDTPKTTEQLQVEATMLNNARNDIATGAEDPFGIAGESGIAYSPAELQAIESANAGVYDPAIVTARAKLDSRRQAEADALEIERDAASAEAKFANDLSLIAARHDNDLEKMKMDQEFDQAMIGYKASLDAQGKAAGGMTPYSDERSFRTVQSIDELLGQVNNWTTGWGSLLKQVPGTDALSFNSQLNTLKAAIAFGELTAMREASKTGGALGNVSNIELGLLESALAGLDSAQEPEDFRGQLQKAKESINRWRTAMGGSALGVQAPAGSKVLISSTGESFDASDLSPEEYQQAVADGYRPQ